MTAYAIPNPFSQWNDLTGLPLTSGYIYIGQPNQDPVTHPMAVYQDAALSIPLAQPIRTVGGFLVGTGTPINAFPTSTPYSISVRNKSNVEVYYQASVVDEIANFFVTIAGPGGAGYIGYTQGGPGSVTRTVQSKLRDLVTPEDFGVGVDGQSLGIGANVLRSNTSGIQNTGFGYHALGSNTGGSENTAFGYNALASVTGGADPIANYNTAFGSNALGLMTTGYKNSAFGRDSSDNLTTGINNTSLGYGSFHLATTAVNSVAVGFESVHGGATGPVTAQGLVGVGFRALYECLSGDFNTAVGLSAMASTTTGQHNAALGTNALNTNVTGSDNTAVGYFAGLTNTGNGNTFIGSGADAAVGLANVTVIGVGVTATQSNRCYLGNNQDVVPGGNAFNIGNSVTPWLGGTFSDIVYSFCGTAPPAGGTTGKGFLLSSTPNFGIFFGSGAPTLNAARGSLYLRTDGSGTSNRMYVNTDGGTTWTAVTTAA